MKESVSAARLGEALFRADGELLLPGVLTQGPWYEGSLHGGAMLAVMARAAEAHASDVPRQVVRLTVDMMRAAPMTPLRVETSTVRAGKSIETVDVAMYAGEDLCVRGSALRMRISDISVDEPDTGVRAPEPPAPGDTFPQPFARDEEEKPAFHHALDVHVDTEQSVVWFRLAVPVVEGEQNTGFVTVATIADWTYAVPYMLGLAAGTAKSPEERTTFAINADTTINVHRPFSGDWLGLASVSHSGPSGAGTSGARLFDSSGLVGFSTQSILIRGPGDAALSVKEVSP